MAAKLTVILPAYNGMPYLPQAVESILGQSFTDFTFIIVNDGSTDGTGEYLSSLTDPRIEIANQVNAGQGASLNAGLQRCKSEFIAYMDADDNSMPDRLRQQLEFMEANPQIVMLGTQIEFLVGAVVQRALRAPTDHDGIHARLLKGRAGVCHPSLMLRTEPALATGGYPTWALGLDIEFCLRMCEQGRVANLDRILYQYRFHANQTSLARYKELISANRYAAHRAICRRWGQPEPSFEAFLQSATRYDRWQWSREAWELNQYRTGRILMASGHPVRSLFRMALLAIFRPFKTIRRTIQSMAALSRGGGN